MSKLLFTGRIERVKYRFGLEYLPERIVKYTELAKEDVIYEQNEDSITFKVGESIHFKHLSADVKIVSKKRYPSGEIVYETDYVVEVIEDACTSDSLKQAKYEYIQYVELREKTFAKLEMRSRVAHKNKGWFGRLFNKS